MKIKNFGLKGKLGICILVLTFAILPFSSGTSLAAGDAAAGGAAGTGGLAGLSTLSVVGITVLAIIMGAVIISSLSDDDAVNNHPN